MSFPNGQPFNLPLNPISTSPECKVFNTALFIHVPKYDNLPTSPSPQLPTIPSSSFQSSSTLNNYLPLDLLDRIERISPANNDGSPNLSRSMSDIELHSKSSEDSNYSLKEEEEDFILNQYDNIKLPSQTKGSIKNNEMSFNSNNQIQLNNNQLKMIKLNFMNNVGINDAFNRKASFNKMPFWVNPNFQGNLSNNNLIYNNQGVKQKKKQKKKKKKEKDEYTTEMFGRRGWICEQCNNFNYDSRNKCNRCGIPKQPKKIVKIEKNNNTIGEGNQGEHKGDWTCGNCNNINYAFRLICNRCQLPREILDKVEV